jgi:hypothetical protein
MFFDAARELVNCVQCGTMAYNQRCVEKRKMELTPRTCLKRARINNKCGLSHLTPNSKKKRTRLLSKQDWLIKKDVK